MRKVYHNNYNKSNKRSDFFTNYEKNSLFDNFSIDSSRYIYTGNDGQWRTSKAKLTFSKVVSHFSGRKSYGYFFKQETNLLVFDVDAHGISRRDRGDFIRSRVDVLVKMFGKPSIITTGRTGVHLYYRLLDKCNTDALAWRANKAIEGIGEFLCGGLNIEVKPTTSHALRFPCDGTVSGNGLLEWDAGKLHRVKMGLLAMDRLEFFMSYFLNSKVYKLEELFKDGLSGYRIKGLGRVSKKAYEKVDRFKASLEKNAAVVRVGSTNDFIVKVGLAGRNCGLSVSEVSNAIIDKLKSKGIPTQTDTTFNGVFRRVSYLYKNRGKDNSVSGGHSSEGFENKREIMEWVLKKMDNDKKLKNRVLRLEKKILKGYAKTGKKMNINKLRFFLISLLSWMEGIKGLKAKQVREMNGIYRRFSFYHNKGLIPLPWDMMRSWHREYKKIIAILTNHNLLSKMVESFKDFGSNVVGICRWFSVKLIANVRYTNRLSPMGCSFGGLGLYLVGYPPQTTETPGDHPISRGIPRTLWEDNTVLSLYPRPVVERTRPTPRPTEEITNPHTWLTKLKETFGIEP